MLSFLAEYFPEIYLYADKMRKILNDEFLWIRL
jgi:hypothetical protein